MQNFYLTDTKLKFIKMPNFYSSVRKRGSKDGRRGINAYVNSWFSAMLTRQPFSVPLVSLLKCLIFTAVFVSVGVKTDDAELMHM